MSMVEFCIYSRSSSVDEYNRKKPVVCTKEVAVNMEDYENETAALVAREIKKCADKEGIITQRFHF
jgi:hypothetical protein